jgi:hypothetical protein
MAKKKKKLPMFANPFTFKANDPFNTQERVNPLKKIFKKKKVPRTHRKRKGGLFNRQKTK